MTHTVFLPLPPSELSPNARCHWRRKSEAIKKYRSDSYFPFRLCLFRLSRQLHTPITVHIVYGSNGKCTGLYQPRDGDNCLASLKAAFDAMKDAGLIPDDSARHLRIGEVIINRRAKQPGVTFHIEENEP